MRTARLIGIAVIIGATVGEATPFHHLSEDSHINCSLRAGPLRHLVTRFFRVTCMDGCIYLSGGSAEAGGAR
jgi:hypothetical protein